MTHVFRKKWRFSGVREGKFRADLCFRISTIPLTVPAAQGVAGRHSLLATGPLGRFAADMGRGELRLAPQSEVRVAALRLAGLGLGTEKRTGTRNLDVQGQSDPSPGSRLRCGRAMGTHRNGYQSDVGRSREGAYRTRIG